MRTEEEIYIEALRRWGIDAQEKMLLEEMMELGKAVLKLHRRANRNRLTQLAEEIADVRIMLDTVEWMYGQRAAVEQWRQKKLKRLERLLWPGRSRGGCGAGTGGGHEQDAN